MDGMTIEEAIKHCEEVADTCEYEASKYDMTDAYERSVACKEGECASEHRQLAEWLRELKKYRAIFEKVGKILADNGYTIDDLDTIFAKAGSESE
jgi:hypothetical protein